MYRISNTGTVTLKYSWMNMFKLSNTGTVTLKYSYMNIYRIYNTGTVALNSTVQLNEYLQDINCSYYVL